MPQENKQILSVIEFDYDEAKKQITSSRNVTPEAWQAFGKKIGLNEYSPKPVVYYRADSSGY